MIISCIISFADIRYQYFLHLSSNNIKVNTLKQDKQSTHAQHHKKNTCVVKVSLSNPCLVLLSGWVDTGATWTQSLPDRIPCSSGITTSSTWLILSGCRGRAFCCRLAYRWSFLETTHFSSFYILRLSNWRF